MTGACGFGMVLAMSESLLAFAVVFVATIAFVAVLAVAIVPLAIRLLGAFA
jgi:hypothetical protein